MSKVPDRKELAVRHNEIPAAKLLRGMGLVGEMLERQERPLPAIRTVLQAKGFSNNEISILFDAFRHERTRGLKVNIRQESGVTYWSLVGVIFKG